jgi:uncharacterized small protein (DUF1192 family)
MEEPAPPRAARGALLDQLAREDLDLYAVEELRDRIDRLETEIQRVQRVMERKQSGRAQADALFSFGRG